MSGVRLAAFSKYFAVGVLCSVVVCGRHCAYMVTSGSRAVQDHCASIGRYADTAEALEAYVEASGYSITKLTAQRLHQSQKDAAAAKKRGASARVGQKAEYVFPE